ncbi:hypothetical protein CDL15_Pgr019218 [Punica granatum]|uniref:Uncharacterized protein n=1 Tax=Punica granatum TaxID=22663 RepID=A0A218W4D5_PUNGR|nr:hypothetical protein CDL15_Pgr019218 [Punica granatum]
MFLVFMFCLFKTGNMSKRKRTVLAAPSQGLLTHKKILHDLIKSKQDMGTWSNDMRRDTKLLPDAVNDKLSRRCSPRT